MMTELILDSDEEVRLRNAVSAMGFDTVEEFIVDRMNVTKRQNLFYKRQQAYDNLTETEKREYDRKYEKFNRVVQEDRPPRYKGLS